MRDRRKSWAILLSTCLLLTHTFLPLSLAAPADRDQSTTKESPSSTSDSDLASLATGDTEATKTTGKDSDLAIISDAKDSEATRSARRKSDLATLGLRLASLAAKAYDRAQSARKDSDLATSRQSPLAPSQFALAATRFIVMLPFLPLIMAVPSLTSVVMPLFLAMQDRLKTILPNMPNLIPNSGGATTTGATGLVSNSSTAHRMKHHPVKHHLFRRSVKPLNERLKGLLPSFLNPRGGTGPASALDGAETVTTRRPVLNIKRPVIKRPSKVVQEGVQEMFELMHKTDDVINQLTSSQPDCRRQAVCRLHHAIDPDIGSFLGNVMDFIKLDTQIEKLDLSDKTRHVMKDVLKAANTGLGQRDCGTVYSRCSIPVHSRGLW